MKLNEVQFAFRISAIFYYTKKSFFYYYYKNLQGNISLEIFNKVFLAYIIKKNLIPTRVSIF